MPLEAISQAVVTIICSIIASSGFWAIVVKRMDKKDASKEMILGLAHDRIMYLCMFYLDRGDWITHDELENLEEYLFKPYLKLGGNGTAKVLMERVVKLRFVKNPI